MSQKLQQQLREVGEKLESRQSSKEALVMLLKQAANCLAEVDQTPLPPMLDSLKPCLLAIANSELLKHQDRDVKVLVATCICEITRITAPEAPYSDDILKDIFQLIVHTLEGLGDIDSPSFGRRVVILETLARYRSCVVMLDLECHDLISEMFSNFFSAVSDKHPENVISSMQKIMILILNESEDVQESILTNILSVLGKHRNGVSQAARRLAMTVIEHCSIKLEPSIKQYLVSSLSGNSNYMEVTPDHHEVIFDLYQCAPQILYGIIPYITGELLTDRLEVRRKAVQLIGDMFSFPGSSISEPFQPLWSEFFKRLTDRAAEIRVSVVGHMKNCLMSNTSRAEASQIIRALADRLLDYDEHVRKHVVAAICDIACSLPELVSSDIAKQVAERLRDKSVSVKRYTMERLADLYRNYYLKNMNRSTENDEYKWVPGRILRCLYDKDFRSESIELVLCGSLFPLDLSAKDKVRSWIAASSLFDKVEVKALEQLLMQKQRLYQELQKYLSLRQTYQENETPEIQKRISVCFRSMSRLFSDSTMAEDSFQILHNVKDANIWRILTSLLDPCSTFSQAWEYRGELLRILTETHPLYEFMSLLSIKCSYMLFNHEYVKEIISLAVEHCHGGNFNLLSCMNLLTVICCFLPLLLSGSEDDLVSLLKEDNDFLKEGIAHVLAKAGGAIRDKLVSMSSSVELLLERLCLEGSRKQAKYSVLALAAITKDEGLMSLSVLYKRIVDVLKEKTHLPAMLQSLGCISQIAMPIFETREEEILKFIINEILSQRCNLETDDGSKNKNGHVDDERELCSLKIFGIKTLVKSYLPIKDTHARPGFLKLIEILKKIICFGNITEETESSPVDKALLKLAASKAILRLSRQWDERIPIDVFYMTLRTLEDHLEFRRQFLSKISQYVKERILEAKFSCAFLLNLSESGSSEFKEAKQNLLEIIQICRQHKTRQLSIQNDLSSTISYPEYILAYFVHAVAHHPSCPSIECKDKQFFAPIYRRLHLLLSLLLLGGDGWLLDNSDKKKEVNITICSIFHSIKSSKDVVDESKTKKSHALSELGLAIAKNLNVDQTVCSDMSMVPLPSVLYEPLKSSSESSLANDDYDWLCGTSAMTYFEALDIPKKEMINPDASNNDVDLEESDDNGNELPLSKVMKILKSHGGKKKNKVVELGSSLSSKSKEADDVLDLVREINLGQLDADGTTEISKFIEDEESEDRPKLLAKKVNTKILVPQKLKSDKTGSLLDLPTPKRKRSSVLNRSLLKRTNGELELKGSPQHIEVEAKKKSLQKPLSAERLPLDVSDSDGRSSVSGKRKKDPIKASDLTQDFAKPLLALSTETDVKISSSKSLAGNAKKRKRRSVAVLAKCSSSISPKNEEEIVGLRIKVWWPMDKQFYEGVVRSFNKKTNKHEVLYDDGDVEVLNLGKEKWEPIANGHTPKKITIPKSEAFSSHKSLAKVKSNLKDHQEQNMEGTSESNMETDTASRERFGFSETLPCSASEGGDDANSVGSKGKDSTPIEDEENIDKMSGEEENPDSPGSSNAEDSDDEPLNAWRLRAGKTV